MRPLTQALTQRWKLVAALCWTTALWVGLTIAFFVSKNSAGPTAVFVGDANYYYAYLPSLVLDGDLDFTNEYVVTGNWYRLGLTPMGKPSNVFGIGPAIFALPLFLVGLLLSKLAGITPNGFGPMEVKAALYASPVFTALAIWPAARLLRRHFGPAWLCWASPVAILLGSSAAYYAIRQPGYSHPFTLFWVAVFTNHWDRGAAADCKRTWTWWALAGAYLGAAVLSRPQVVTWAVLLSWPAWLDLKQKVGVRAAVGRWGAAIVAATLVFLPQMIAWKLMYGGWLHIPQGREFMRWDAPEVSAVLFSSRNGLLAFTPLLTLCLLGYLTLQKRHLRLGLFLLLAFALQVIVNGAVWDWWAGGSYGGRRFDSCFVVFCLGLVALLTAAWRYTGPLVGRLSQRQRRLIQGISIAASVPICLYVLTLIAGNIALTSKTSPANLISEAGTPLYKKLEERIPAPWNGCVAGLSYWATKPARALFQRRYGSDATAYDWAVGKFFLGDTYPGLNSRLPARAQNVTLHVTQPFLIGHDPYTMPVTTKNGWLRILVPINRKHGPLDLRLELQRTPAQRVSAKWNDGEVPARIEGAALAISPGGFKRGVNVLDLQLDPNTALLSLSLSVPENGLP